MAAQLTAAQQEKLVTFRNVVEKSGLLKEGDTIAAEGVDRTLVRFLKARNWDVKKARNMFADAQKWRANTLNGKSMDQLYDEVDPFYFDKKVEIAKYWPMFFHKTDKMGRPINVQQLGNIDIKHLYEVTSPDYHWHTVLVNCECLTREVLPACRKSTGNDNITGAYCIVDLKGFSIGQFSQFKTLAQNSFQVSQDYYPETMGCLRVINAPAAFNVIWKVVKRWLAKETVQKIDILGSDYESTLLADIAPENLPPWLSGGTCSCTNCLKGAGPWLEAHHRSQDRSSTQPQQPERPRTPTGPPSTMDTTLIPVAQKEAERPALVSQPTDYQDALQAPVEAISAARDDSKLPA